MNALEGLSAVQVLGPTDAAKFRSCLTLFGFVDPSDVVFRVALDKFFSGVPDQATLDLLGDPRNGPCANMSPLKRSREA